MFVAGLCVAPSFYVRKALLQSSTALLSRMGKATFTIGNLIILLCSLSVENITVMATRWEASGAMVAKLCALDCVNNIQLPVYLCGICGLTTYRMSSR